MASALRQAQGDTPMMRQYRSLKERHSDCLLFFRLGDFYELFFEDAVETSRLLNLTLTKRQTAPMCGIPYHAVDSYLGRLTRLGKKVAICEQLSDPSLPGIVERDVIRVVTPGTTFDERILDQKSNRFIVSVILAEKIGLAACDLTTGFLQVASLKNLEELREEIFRLNPAECIVDAAEKNLPDFLKQFEKLPVFPHQCWEEPYEFVSKQFRVKDLRGFGIHEFPEAVNAACWLIHYLRETQKSDVSHIKPPQLLTRTDEMILDETAIRNLELFVSLREGKREGSLFSVLDMTKTSMGGRMLRSWLLHPLHYKEKIEERLNAISEILETAEIFMKGREMLDGVLDLERLLGRISIGTGNARDALGIAFSLKILEPMRDLLSSAKSLLLRQLGKSLQQLGALASLRDNILKTIVENPPLSLKEGGLIRDGVSDALDELRSISREGKGFVQKLQEREIQRTGIQSLKIRYNQIFGYYIEITKANLKHVPADYIRKQTMVNAERFITPELKEYEEKILGAEEKMHQLEYEIFLRLREEIQARTRDIQTAAEIFAVFDTLLSLAEVASKNRYARPKIADDSGALAIKNGRHPVVERLAGGKFVPNDAELGEGKKIILLTGPNMGGKSTYLRQTALIVLLAHIGSFVPADSAHIPLIDRIFTRVGATDNLVRGQSTFMVEMQETSQILHYATKNSLIILDEIGRGTSTYDGVSLAWAILEYIHDRIGAKTLFATHYHELIGVAEKLARAENFSVAVKEEAATAKLDAAGSHSGAGRGRIAVGDATGKEIVFLYRVVPGAINKSYGIEVAKLAGLPNEVIAKAKNILNDLEEGIVDKAINAQAKAHHLDPNQLEIFTSSSTTVPRKVVLDKRPHRALEALQKIDVNELTPLEALAKLDELKKSIEN